MLTAFEAKTKSNASLIPKSFRQLTHSGWTLPRISWPRHPSGWSLGSQAPVGWMMVRWQEAQVIVITSLRGERKKKPGGLRSRGRRARKCPSCRPGGVEVGSTYRKNCESQGQTRKGNACGCRPSSFASALPESRDASPPLWNPGNSQSHQTVAEIKVSRSRIGEVDGTDV